MNECIDVQLQELLPDLVHESLDRETRRRVEAHLATCDSCKEDLEVLRTVKGAAVFAPAINVDSIVRQIPPYRMIVPGVEQPKRTRMVSWLVAAGLALAVAGGGTLVMSNRGPTSGTSQTMTASVPKTPMSGSQENVSPVPQSTGVAEAPNRVVASTAVQAPVLALATNVDDLSDGNLVRLMDDMDNFDALPAAEPEPVIAVDSGDSL